MIDDARNDYVMDELKIAKKNIKEYFKERKKIIKALKEVNLDRDADRNEFSTLEKKLRLKQQGIDQYISDSRIRVIEKIESDEWEEIMKLASEQGQNQKSKEEEKELKGKINDVFTKLETKINKVIQEEERPVRC